ncbi:MAG: hypothetical protein NTX81_01385 [Candidatus Bathyarchaeota archaeon]|nr:hypothetical protein [Candidatus Bathyarchaeota archaeon]
MAFGTSKGSKINSFTEFRVQGAATTSGAVVATFTVPTGYKAMIDVNRCYGQATVAMTITDSITDIKAGTLVLGQITMPYTAAAIGDVAMAVPGTGYEQGYVAAAGVKLTFTVSTTSTAGNANFVCPIMLCDV